MVDSSFAKEVDFFMAQFEIRDWCIADTFDLERGPDDPLDFCVDFRIDVGEVGKPGVSNHQFYVCTPSGVLSNFDTLAQYLSRVGNYRSGDGTLPGFFGRGLLIVGEFSVDSILAMVSAVIDRIDQYSIDVT